MSLPRHQLYFAAALVIAISILWSLAPHPLTVLPLALLPVSVAVSLRQPMLMATLFILFSFFRLHEIVPQLMPFKLPQLTALAALASLGWGLWKRDIRMTWEPIYTPFVLFFALVSCGMFLGTNTGNSLDYWQQTYVKIALMVFTIGWLIRTPDDFAFISRAIVVAGMIVATVALYNKFAGIGLVEGSRVTIGRDIGSVLGDPNDLSLVLLFPTGFALASVLAAEVPKSDRVLGLLAVLLCALAIIATQSRGGLMGFLAVASVFAWRRTKSKTLLVTAGIIAAVALFSIAGIADRQSGGAHEAGIDESAMGRVHAWVAALRMAAAHPVSGVGLDNFYYNYYLFSDFWDGQNHAVHSTWFGVMAEAGPIGFALFSALVILMFTTIHRAERDLVGRKIKTAAQLVMSGEALFAGLVGFCVSGTFLTQGFTWPLYIMLGMTAALSRAVKLSNFREPKAHSGEIQSVAFEATPVAASKRDPRIGGRPDSPSQFVPGG